MPDLSEQAVAEWVREAHSAQASGPWPPLVRGVELEQGLPPPLERIGAALDELDNGDVRILSEALRSDVMRQELQAVLAQLGAGRLLRLVHWLPERPVADCHLVLSALVEGGTREAQALRSALAALTRRATLHRIFHPSRIAALDAACASAFTEAS